MPNSIARPKHRYFLAGILTIIPLWITWLVLSLLFRTLSSVGAPFARWLATLAQGRFPALPPLLTSNAFQNTLAFVLVVAVIYALGILSSVVIGRRLVGFFEAMLERVPFVKHVYGSVKKLMNVLREKPGEGMQRVVLIDFPSPEMKTVGLVTRVMEDANTGRKVAAVYVPTTPNPTNGFLEIVPVDRLTPTEWTMDEAMSFIISGGAIAPKSITYDPSSNEASLPSEI